MLNTVTTVLDSMILASLFSMHHKTSELSKVNIFYFPNWIKGFLMCIKFSPFDSWGLTNDDKNICTSYTHKHTCMSQ